MQLFTLHTVTVVRQDLRRLGIEVTREVRRKLLVDVIGNLAGEILAEVLRNIPFLADLLRQLIELIVIEPAALHIEHPQTVAGDHRVGGVLLQLVEEFLHGAGSADAVVIRSIPAGCEGADERRTVVFFDDRHLAVGLNGILRTHERIGHTEVTLRIRGRRHEEVVGIVAENAGEGGVLCGDILRTGTGKQIAVVAAEQARTAQRLVDNVTPIEVVIGDGIHQILVLVADLLLLATVEVKEGRVVAGGLAVLHLLGEGQRTHLGLADMVVPLRQYTIVHRVFAHTGIGIPIVVHVIVEGGDAVVAPGFLQRFHRAVFLLQPGLEALDKRLTEIREVG